MNRLRRALGVALALSLAAHAALIVAPWSRRGAGVQLPPPPSVLVTRLVRADLPEAMAPEAVATQPPAQSAAVAVVPLPDLPVAAEQPRSPLQPPVPPPQGPAESNVANPAALPASATASRADATNDRDSMATPIAAAPSSGLDRGPQPLDEIEPAFPAAAGNRGGVVTLRLVISDQGAVETIEILASSPPGVFDAAALAAFGHARFSPGLKGGVAVRSEVRYDVTFAPIGRGTDTSGRTY